MSYFNDVLSKVFGFRVVRDKKLAKLIKEPPQDGVIEAVGRFYRSRGVRVDTDIDPAQRREVFERTRQVWARYGETDPYWSVLTDPKFHLSAMNDAALKEFFSTGSDTAKLIDEFSARSRTSKIAGTCLELGCGVGRVTMALAKKFDKVIGIDISEGNLAIAQSVAENVGIKNVEFKLVNSLEDIGNVEPFDFLFSTIVLQHNPPPVQEYILDCLLGKIKEGGGCLFQLSTEHPASDFDIQSYLSKDTNIMEMHSLPMEKVFRLLERHKLPVLDVRPDAWTGCLGSFTFFAFPKRP